MGACLVIDQPKPRCTGVYQHANRLQLGMIFRPESIDFALLRPEGFDYPLRPLGRCQHGPSQTAYCNTVGVLSRLKGSAAHFLN